MLNTLFVIDDLSLVDRELKVISFWDYLKDYPKLNEPRTRIINLCNTERYLSQGYYCSLLAEARQHQVIPSVKVINTLRSADANQWISDNMLTDAITASDLGRSHVVCMGEVMDGRFRKLAYNVFRNYTAPILLLTYIQESGGVKIEIKRSSLAELDDAQRAFCFEVLEEYSKKNWRTRKSGKKFRWDLAMLVDQNELVPPSNRAALNRFVKAGEKLGIRAQVVSIDELVYVNQFDALFIRETTAIDHHTYKIACEAETANLVVVDDPDSILRCCNKVFLQDAFEYQGVPSLPTKLISDLRGETLDEIEKSIAYPLVLKTPEGSFSSGVFKARDRRELQQIAGDLLQKSALVLAQEYALTEYDWRIGVFNGRAIYACRYYMASNHWQIYNHGSKRNFSGGFDTLPTFEVPGYVLNAALSAAKVVGSGLYGIDIKSIDGRAYVLEVNDNPSIDHGVEDAYLGEELYMQVMSEFLRRLEQRGR